MSTPTSDATTRTYRFGDASAPGVLLGLPVRQAVPVIAGVLCLAASLQTPLGPAGGVIGVAAGGFVAFGRWRGAPVAEVAVPALRLWSARRIGRRRWTRAVLLATPSSRRHPTRMPGVLAGLELLEVPAGGSPAGTSTPMAVVRDRRAGTLTAVLRVSGTGFPLATRTEQDNLLSRWGSALSPFARDRSPVTRVVWQESTGPGGADAADRAGGAHRQYLASVGTPQRAGEHAVADYLALVDQQEPAAREVLITLTVDQRRVRTQRAGRTGRPGARLQAGLDVLAEETRLFGDRLEAASLSVDALLDAPTLAATVRRRSDPSCTAQIATLAAAAGRATPEWGPMAAEPAWDRMRVDGSWHRSYRVAAWPALPVPADWLLPFLTGSGTSAGKPAGASRTVTVVMEPVPLSRSARTTDREAMAREADADSKARRGFRVGARERKRLSEVEARERELAQGHAELRFAALVDVAASDEAGLADATTAVEQAAAQSLLDLRPLDARHDLGWVASLPLGRNVRQGREPGL